MLPQNHPPKILYSVECYHVSFAHFSTVDSGSTSFFVYFHILMEAAYKNPTNRRQNLTKKSQLDTCSVGLEGERKKSVDEKERGILFWGVRRAWRGL